MDAEAKTTPLLCTTSALECRFEIINFNLNKVRKVDSRRFSRNYLPQLYHLYLMSGCQSVCSHHLYLKIKKVLVGQGEGGGVGGVGGVLTRTPL